MGSAKEFVRARTFAALFGIAAACGACATSGGGPGSANPDMISQEQVLSLQDLSNAYEIVQRLRPSWLRERANTSLSGNDPIIVFLDGIRYGEVGTMRSINLQAVDHIERVDSRDATTRWGTGFGNGAILVYLK